MWSRSSRQARAVVVPGLFWSDKAAWERWHEASGKNPPFREQGEPVPGSIAEINYLRLGGLDQWVMIRGEIVSNPPLILLHGGPGFTEMRLFRHFNAPLSRQLPCRSSCRGRSPCRGGLGGDGSLLVAGHAASRPQSNELPLGPRNPGSLARGRLLLRRTGPIEPEGETCPRGVEHQRVAPTTFVAPFPSNPVPLPLPRSLRRTITSRAKDGALA